MAGQLRSDSIALTGACLSLCLQFSRSGLALSGASRQLSQRESLGLCWMPKPLPMGEVALRSNDGEGKDAHGEALAPGKHHMTDFCSSGSASASRAARPL